MLIIIVKMSKVLNACAHAVTAMLAEERRSRLLELVRQQGFAALPELAGQLQVSESTVRRDLEVLEEAGTAKRTHGGVFYAGSSPKLPHFDERQPAQWDKKRAIARRAGRTGRATATRCCWTAERRPTKWPGCWSAGRCRS